MITIAPNGHAERTGQKGSMPDTEYDIHCDAVGGPDYKLNYLSDSCKLRLAAGSCEQGDCIRYVGDYKQPRQVTTPKVVKKIGRPRINMVRECKCCGNWLKTRARGLCVKCYDMNLKADTMFLYPTDKQIANAARGSNSALD